MGFFSKTKKKFTKAVKNEFKQRAEISSARKTALHEARLAETKTFAKKKAAMETKEALKKPKSFNFGGFAGPTQQGRKATPGIADTILGGTTGPIGGGGILGGSYNPKIKKKKSKKRKKGKSITINLG